MCVSSYLIAQNTTSIYIKLERFTSLLSHWKNYQGFLILNLRLIILNRILNKTTMSENLGRFHGYPFKLLGDSFYDSVLCGEKWGWWDWCWAEGERWSEKGEESEAPGRVVEGDWWMKRSGGFFSVIYRENDWEIYPILT